MGPEQSRPKHFNDALNSPFELKRELPSFLMKEWQRQHFSGIIGNRDIYVGHLHECLHLFVEDGILKSEKLITCDAIMLRLIQGFVFMPRMPTIAQT